MYKDCRLQLNGMLGGEMGENNDGPLEKEDNRNLVGKSMAGGLDSSSFLGDVA
mgnify:FL=1